MKLNNSCSNLTLRFQALEYLRTNQSEDKPFGLERNIKGLLRHEHLQDVVIPKHDWKLSLTVKPSPDQILVRKNHLLFFTKGNKFKPFSKATLQDVSINKGSQTQRQQVRQSFLILNPNELIVQDRNRKSQIIIEAIKFKSTQQEKTLKDLTDGADYEQKSVQGCSIPENRFKLVMSKLDANQFVQLHQNQSKRRIKKQTKLHSIMNITPDLGYYEPQWDKILTKTTTNVFIPRQNRPLSKVLIHDQLQQSFHTEIHQKVKKHENGYEYILQDLKTQIQREVNSSIFNDPDQKHPLKKISAKVLDKIFIEQFKNEMGSKIKESQNARQRFTLSMQHESKPSY